MSDINTDNYSDNQLYITEEIRAFLIEAVRWSKFLSILGFVGMGLMVIMGLFVSRFMSSMSQLQETALPFSPAFLSFFYIILAAVYFFPILYLYRFSNRTKEALLNHDQYVLNDAFDNLKKHYKFIGILAVVMIALYAIMFVIGLFAAVFASF